jgi:hypothetical protein
MARQIAEYANRRTGREPPSEFARRAMRVPATPRRTLIIPSP